ncbi:MAG TPA: hypothetical protein VLA28_03055 [Afifellaceae bacterium]|nr:hypothetical protein [Afifellaceae bacterium]
MRRQIAAGTIAAVATALAACATRAPDYLEYAAYQDTNTVATRIAERVGACWFDGGNTAFARFAYAPELNSFSGKPRILVVPKDNPAGLPKLVIEVSEGKRATVVKLFGPLLATARGTAIQRDVERWADGGTEC